MCLQAIIRHDHQEIKIVWGKRHKIPAWQSNRCDLFLWGCYPKEGVRLPRGGYVFLNEVMSGVYDRYFPKKVWISVISFYLPRGRDGGAWYHLNAKQKVEGVLFRESGEIRLYWLMLIPNAAFMDMPMWPKIHYNV